jgi:hypothetical protein
MHPSSLHLCGGSNFILGEEANILRRQHPSSMNSAVGKVVPERKLSLFRQIRIGRVAANTVFH